MPKTTRGESNLGTRLAEKIEGGEAKLTGWGVGVCTKDDKYRGQELWREQ